MARGVSVTRTPVGSKHFGQAPMTEEHVSSSTKEYYTVTTGKELHHQRRRAMLDKYPDEIRALFGHDVYEGLFCLCTVILQFCLAYAVRNMDNLFVLFVLTYVVSGTLNHSLLLAMHEVTHDLFFRSRRMNQICSYLVNLPMGVPAASMFKIYHSEHHTGMGIENMDTDIPTVLEAHVFRGVIGKSLWLFLQPVFYGVRPFVIRPPSAVSGSAVLVMILQCLFDFAVYYCLGWKSFFYLFGGTFLGAGLHPMSGHFVAEHFEFKPGQETYSYYGPMNLLTYNVGLHNEHHDFPNIPGSRLHRLRKIAPEFYDHLATHTSWVGVITKFIFDPNITLFSRILRR